MFDGMKRTTFFLMAALCAMPGAARAQDAATEERLNQLNSKIQVLIEGQDLQRKRIEALEKEVATLQQPKTEVNYGEQEPTFRSRPARRAHGRERLHPSTLP